MNKYWRVIGITALVTGALIYPAIKLYQYIARKNDVEKDKDNGDHHLVKAFVPAYRGKKHKAGHN